MKKKDKKLKISDIIKNPEIERKNFIHYFVEHEREMMAGTTLFIIILLCLFLYTCLFAVRYKDSVDVYRDGNLKVSYNIVDSGVNDLITTSNDNIIYNNIGKKNEYILNISNSSNKRIKYILYIEEDSELIKIEDCRDKLVNLDALRFSINDGKELKLKELSKDMYSISKDYLNPNQEKIIKLKVWIDKNSMKDINKYHFYGRIVLSNL